MHRSGNVDDFTNVFQHVFGVSDTEYNRVEDCELWYTKFRINDRLIALIFIKLAYLFYR